MNNASKEKSEQLGINFFTATSRLKKELLFSMVVKLKEDSCFRCKQKIISSGELSVDHKKSWLHISADLFWDLDNIAFSHLKCNKTDRRFIPTKKLNPPGKTWCGACKDFRELKEFSKTKTGLFRNRCNSCRKSKKWEHGNRVTK